MKKRQAGPQGPATPVQTFAKSGGVARRRGRPATDMPGQLLFCIWRAVREELAGPRDVSGACKRVIAMNNCLLVFDAKGRRCGAPIRDANTLRTRYNEIEARRLSDPAAELGLLCAAWEQRRRPSRHAARVAAAERQVLDRSFAMLAHPSEAQTLAFLGAADQPAVEAAPTPKKNATRDGGC